MGIGVMAYRPALGDVRHKLRDEGHPLVDQHPRSLFLSLVVPAEQPTLWYEVYYTNYDGKTNDDALDIHLNNWGLSFVAGSKEPKTWPFVGCGTNLLHMRRHREETWGPVTRNDFRFGLHGQIGLCVTPVKKLGIEVRYLWHWFWDTPARWGTEWDLGDGSAAAMVSLVL
jgi:hypothetical protein